MKLNLINEEKPTGSYEVKFDADQNFLAVYIFIRLYAGDFIETRKMLLLK